MFKHLILTRFFMTTKGCGYDGTQGEVWLLERIKLFRDFCYPTIVRQTCQNFTWLLFCRKDTPAHLKELLQKEFETADIHFIFTNSMKESTEEYSRGYRYVLTTRLDNDDGLNPLYIERVQGYFDKFVKDGHAALLVNFGKGYKYVTGNGRLYRHEKDNAAFMTLFEDLDRRQLGTVYEYDHSEMHKNYPTIIDTSIVGWMMVIHGGNVLNRLGMRDVVVPLDFVFGWYGDQWPRKK